MKTHKEWLQDIADKNHTASKKRLKRIDDLLDKCETKPDPTSKKRTKFLIKERLALLRHYDRQLSLAKRSKIKMERID